MCQRKSYSGMLSKYISGCSQWCQRNIEIAIHTLLSYPWFVARCSHSLLIYAMKDNPFRKWQHPTPYFPVTQRMCTSSHSVRHIHLHSTNYPNSEVQFTIILHTAPNSTIKNTDNSGTMNALYCQCIWDENGRQRGTDSPLCVWLHFWFW